MTRRVPLSGVCLALLGAVMLALAPTPAHAQLGALFGGSKTVITNANVLLPGGRTIEGCTIILSGGRIEAMGPNVEVPSRADVIDAGGGYVTPTFVDPCGATGLIGEAGSSAEHHALDAFDRYATDAFRELVRHGVTAMYLPARGSAGVTGRGVIVRLKPGDGPWAGEVLEEDAALCVDLASNQRPVQRLSIYRGVHRMFKSAIEYRESLDMYEEELEEYEEKIAERAKKNAEEEKKNGKKGAAAQDDGGDKAKKDEKKEEIKKPKEPAPQPAMDIVLQAIDREFPVRIRAERSADILNAIELADEFGFDLILEGAAEAHLIAEAIAEAEAPVILDTFISGGAHDRNLPAGAASGGIDALNEAGVEWYVATGEGGALPSRFLFENAQLASARSLSERVDPVALATTKPATLLGLRGRVGSLRRGGQADFVLWSGRPGDAGARVQRVYVDGQLVFQGDAGEEGQR